MVDTLFTLQSKGIERRNRRYKEAWGSHLLNTQMISAKFLEPQLEVGKTLTILGAGRLLDFPQFLYNKFSDQITLVDRSRLPLRGFSKKTAYYDVTGSLERWCEHLALLRLTNPETMLAEIESISLAHPLLSQPCFRDEMLLSLNLLSQLPVYWQNAVFDIFSTRYPKEPAKEWENKILKALQPSSRALIKSHIKALIPRGKHKKSILITDTHYLYYKVSHSKILNAPLFELSSKANTMQDLDIEFRENANNINLESMDALFGISIAEEIGKESKVQLLNKWLWDIVPINAEKKDAGTKHIVIALEIEA